MKLAKYIIFIIIACHILACAHLTRHFDTVERDEFLNKLPMMNMEILGGIKYDDPKLNLKTLGIQEYSDLYKYADITEDYETVIDFIADNTSEKYFSVRKDTFIVCLFSESHQFVLCDKAQTPGIDKIQTGGDIKNLNDFYDNFVSSEQTGNQY